MNWHFSSIQWIDISSPFFSCVQQALIDDAMGGGCGGGRDGDVGSGGGANGSSYRELMPNLVQKQFQVEVLAMSRAAGQKACSVCWIFVSFCNC